MIGVIGLMLQEDSVVRGPGGIVETTVRPGAGGNAWMTVWESGWQCGGSAEELLSR